MTSRTPIMRFLQSARRILPREPHPHARLPTTMAPHRPDYGLRLRNVARSGAVYVPIMATLLGWPLMVRVAAYGR